MRLNLKQLFSEENKSERISYTFAKNLQQELGVGKPEETTINVTGTAKNTLGFLTLSLQVQFTLRYVCDRCLDEASKEFSFSPSHEIYEKSNGEMDEQAFINSDGELDLDALLVSDIGLSLPSKFLCREDCKGICPICGQNKNTGNCDCEEREIDPRLEALKQLLK